MGITGDEAGPADRLALAAADLIGTRGLSEASARAIAARAGLSASAINYNFGSLERLLSSAFGRGAERTRAWLAPRAAEIRMLPATAEGAARALEHVVRLWTTEARDLALLYQEAHAAQAGQAWTRLWRDFWRDAAEAFGLGEIEGRLIHLVFECEALHQLSTWSPALEGAFLRELVDHFAGAYLAAPTRADGEFLLQAETKAGAREPGSISPPAMRIAVAAAEVVEASGLGGLTHRAVAARAGVTTGSVTHHFRTIEDLVTGAIRGHVQILTEASAMGGGGADVTTLAQLFQGIAHHVVDEPQASPLRQRLFLAAVRRPELAQAGAIIRFSHGITTREMLARLTAFPRGVLALHAGLISRFASVFWIACAVDPDPHASRARLLGEIETRFIGAATAQAARPT